MVQQAETLGGIQQASGKPIVVAIRPATNVEGFQQSLDFQELCWRAGLATYPSIARAGVALGHLLRWQRMRGDLPS
jgi:acyl-CoA synthetase (NDP forming)